MNAGRSLVTQSSYGSTRQSLNIRPQISTSIDANSFNNWGGATHDLRFGFGWRQVKATTGTLYPGNMILALENSVTNTRARVYREGLGTDQARYVDFYIGDSIALGRTTFDVGVRYDQQWGASLPSETQSNKAFSSLVPGIQSARGRRSLHMEERLAACRRHVRPGCGAQDYPASELQPIRRTVEHRLFAISKPECNCRVCGVPLEDLNGNHLAEDNEVDTSTVLSFAERLRTQRLQPRWHRQTGSTPISRRQRHDQPSSVSIVSCRPTSGLQINYSFTRHERLRSRHDVHTMACCRWRVSGRQVIIFPDRC